MVIKERRLPATVVIGLPFAYYQIIRKVRVKKVKRPSAYQKSNK